MTVELLGTQAPLMLYGVSAKSGDKTQAKDIGRLAKQYWTALGKAPGTVLPFYVISRNYNAHTGNFDLFIGGKEVCSGLDPLLLPESDYAKIEVKPKLGFLWGPAIGEAKRYLYQIWMPASGYEAVNLEYELHDEKSLGKSPKISILFAIRRKGASSY